MVKKPSQPEFDVYREYFNSMPELQRILQMIAEQSREYQSTVFPSLLRYMREGERRSYRTNRDNLLEFLRERELEQMQRSEGIDDLAAGPGELVRDLAITFPDKEVYGIDLSPSFVGAFNTENRLPNARMDVGLIDIQRPRDSKNSKSVVCTLALDRVYDPRMLIENMAQYNGVRMLATLLPVVPEDDNPSLRKAGKVITYTPMKNRIVPGCNKREDRKVLTELLTTKWKCNVRSTDVPYTVYSSGDTQKYDLAVFFT